MSRQRTLQVGTTALIAFTTGVIGVFAGTLQMRNAGQIDFRGPDVALTVTGAELLHLKRATCTGSGGKPNYDFCAVYKPEVFTDSGTLLRTTLECGGFGPATPGTVDLAFAKGVGGDPTVTGSQIITQRAAMVTTGGILTLFTGSTIWNGADILRVGTTTDFPAASADCVLQVESRDKYGN